MSESIQSVLVIGAGTMGAGIAEVVAKAGCTAQLCDVDPQVIETGMGRIQKSLAKAVEKKKISSDDAEAAKARIEPLTDIREAKAPHLVIEAVPESMRLKTSLLGGLSKSHPDAIMATNTSSLSVTEIAAACAHPERVIGMHFFNPPPIMKLLEIVRAEQTNADIVTQIQSFAERIGKAPIVVRDVAGFASSRLGLVIGLEAMRMLEQGVASAADIDKAMELGYRHPMGPLKLTDHVGLDVRLAIAEHLTQEIGPQFTPPPILRQKVRAGKLGKKTGEGFYVWKDGQAVG